MNINKQKFSFQDIQEASINNQVHYYGSSLTESDSSKVYFILATNGTVTLKDKTGTTTELVLSSNNSFNYPIRMDGGFQVTGTNIAVAYCFIQVMPDYIAPNP